MLHFISIIIKYFRDNFNLTKTAWLPAGVRGLQNNLKKKLAKTDTCKHLK